MSIREPSSGWTDLTPTLDHSTTVYGLSASGVYEARVRANNGAGSSPWINVTFVIPGIGLPNAPMSLIKAGVTGSSVQLSWCPPLNDGGSSIVTYYVRYTLTGAELWQDTVVPVAPLPRVAFTTRDGSVGCASTTLSGLAPASDYVAEVTAETTPGLRSESASLAFTSGEASEPSRPLSLAVQAATGGAVMLSWRFPVDNGGAPIVGFQVWAVHAGATVTSQPVSSVSVDATPTDGVVHGVLGGLANNQQYTVYIAAANQDGKQGNPADIAVKTKRAATRPGLCADVRAVHRDGGSIRLEWSAPVDTGGYPLTGFVVEYTRAGRLGTASISVSSPTAVITGLTPVTQYNVRVAAVTAWLTGPWTAASTMHTGPASPPSAPIILGFSPRADGVSVVDVAVASTGGDPPASVSVEVVVSLSATGTVVASVTSSSLSIEVTGLSPGTEYSMVATASNSVGSSPASEALAVTYTPPSQEVRTRVVSVTSTTLKVAWEPVEPSSGFELVGYQVRRVACVRCSCACSSHVCCRWFLCRCTRIWGQDWQFTAPHWQRTHAQR